MSRRIETSRDMNRMRASWDDREVIGRDRGLATRRAAARISLAMTLACVIAVYSVQAIAIDSSAKGYGFVLSPKGKMQTANASLVLNFHSNQPIVVAVARVTFGPRSSTGANAPAIFEFGNPYGLVISPDPTNGRACALGVSCTATATGMGSYRLTVTAPITQTDRLYVVTLARPTTVTVRGAQAATRRVAYRRFTAESSDSTVVRSGNQEVELFRSSSSDGFKAGSLAIGVLPCTYSSPPTVGSATLSDGTRSFASRCSSGAPPVALLSQGGSRWTFSGMAEGSSLTRTRLLVLERP